MGHRATEEALGGRAQQFSWAGVLAYVVLLPMMVCVGLPILGRKVQPTDVVFVGALAATLIGLACLCEIMIIVGMARF